MIVHTRVSQVRRHSLDGTPAPEFEEIFVVLRIELEQGATELETLGPLRPAAGRVLAADGEHGAAPGGIPFLVEQADLVGGKIEELVEPGQ